ncbi:hypothetical protein OfM1_18950 [Lactovum odontotermitis]
MRRQILTRDIGLCQYCNLFGQVTPADMVDHVVPREVSRAKELDESNLVSSCNACHNTKTKWEQKYYGTGQRNKIKEDAVMILDYKNLKFIFEK